MSAIAYTAPALPGARIPIARPRLGAFLSLHCLLLLGYALFGKPFAYLGFGGLFVGEIVLTIGTLLFLMFPRQWLALRTWRLAPLFALMVWCAIRTIPYIPVYGLGALRDAAIWGYGWYAVLVTAIIVSRPTAVSDLLDRYRVFVLLFLLITPAVWMATNVLEFWTFSPGGRDTSVLKAAEITVHLAGVVAFLYLHVRKVSSCWLILTPALFAMTLTSRASIVAFFLGMSLLLLLRPKTGKVILLLGAFAAVITFATLLDLRVEVPGAAREISLESASSGVQSIFVETGVSRYDGTKQWRLRWWRSILAYTWNGEYFWTGKGFGINLADADGFVVDSQHALRSPHNGHLTFLARAGVPGFLLWLITQGTWAASMLACYRRCNREGPHGLGPVFLFLLVYWTAFMVNSSFDVFLEGPMAGIWFWTLYGAGLGTVTVFRQTRQTRKSASTPLPKV